jgi:hypothetical protein
MTPRQRVEDAITKATTQVAREIGVGLREKAGLRKVYDCDMIWRYGKGTLVGQVGAGVPAAEVHYIIESLGKVINGSTPQVKRSPHQAEIETFGTTDGLGVLVWGVIEREA